jgi:hypothetical protein
MVERARGFAEEIRQAEIRREEEEARVAEEKAARDCAECQRLILDILTHPRPVKSSSHRFPILLGYFHRIPFASTVKDLIDYIGVSSIAMNGCSSVRLQITQLLHSNQLVTLSSSTSISFPLTSRHDKCVVSLAAAVLVNDERSRLHKRVAGDMKVIAQIEELFVSYLPTNNLWAVASLLQDHFMRGDIKSLEELYPKETRDPSFTLISFVPAIADAQSTLVDYMRSRMLMKFDDRRGGWIDIRTPDLPPPTVPQQGLLTTAAVIVATPNKPALNASPPTSNNSSNISYTNTSGSSFSPTSVRAPPVRSALPVLLSTSAAPPRATTQLKPDSIAKPLPSSTSLPANPTQQTTPYKMARAPPVGLPATTAAATLAKADASVKVNAQPQSSTVASSTSGTGGTSVVIKKVSLPISSGPTVQSATQASSIAPPIVIAPVNYVKPAASTSRPSGAVSSTITSQVRTVESSSPGIKSKPSEIIDLTDE